MYHQMQKQVDRKQAPKNVDRVDKGNKQFISYDNSKKIRFDIKTKPNESPHINLEYKTPTGESVNKHIYLKP